MEGIISTIPQTLPSLISFDRYVEPDVVKKRSTITEEFELTIWNKVAMNMMDGVILI